MSASGRPITFLLCCLLGSAASSPVSTLTPAPPLPPHVVLPSSSPGSPPPPPPPPPAPSGGGVGCPLTLSPSSLVVRFGDPVTANCSVSTPDFSGLGWEVSLASPGFTMARFLVWRVDSMTDWAGEPKCYALSEQGGQCHIDLPLTVYQPPENVWLGFAGHAGPTLAGRQYTLQCTVRGVAPVEDLVVTFFRGRTPLGRMRSDNKDPRPVTESFSFNITPRREDDGVQYWCEARLELGPGGPERPLVVKSQTVTDTVLYGPQLSCPPRLQVRAGERLRCEVRGNPPPLVVWFRDGRAVAPPTHSSAKDAGKYTVCAEGFLGQTNFTVEVVVLPGRGTTNSVNEHFLLAALLTQIINWL